MLSSKVHGTAASSSKCRVQGQPIRLTANANADETDCRNGAMPPKFRKCFCNARWPVRPCITAARYSAHNEMQSHPLSERFGMTRCRAGRAHTHTHTKKTNTNKGSVCTLEVRLFRSKRTTRGARTQKPPAEHQTVAHPMWNKANAMQSASPPASQLCLSPLSMLVFCWRFPPLKFDFGAR